MEVGRLTPDWFRILVGDTIDSTEVRGWRKTGRPKQLQQSFTELKTVRCIIHGPEWEEVYKIPEMSKLSFLDKTLELPSSMLGESTESIMSSKFRDTTRKEPKEIDYVQNMEDMSKTPFSDEIQEEYSSSSSHGEKPESLPTHGLSGEIKKIVLEIDLRSQTKRQKAMKVLSKFQGIKSIDFDIEDGRLTVIGDVNPMDVTKRVRKIEGVYIISVEPAKEHETEFIPAYESAKKHKHRTIQKIVLEFRLGSQAKVLQALSSLQGIQSIVFNTQNGRLTVIGDVQPVEVFNSVLKIDGVYIINVNDAFEPTKNYETSVTPAYKSSKEDKGFQQDRRTCSLM